jgi:hypothetical protein
MQNRGNKKAFDWNYHIMYFSYILAVWSEVLIFSIGHGISWQLASYIFMYIQRVPVLNILNKTI